MPDTQYRYVELRAVEGRRVQGRAITYGDTASLPWGKERIAVGAFGDVDTLDLILNAQHDRARPLARTGGGGLALQDGPEVLDVIADLPATAASDEALAMIAAGLLRGLSVEFVPTRTRSECGVTVVERARLTGLGVVDKPAYVLSTLREKPRRRLWL